MRRLRRGEILRFGDVMYFRAVRASYPTFQFAYGVCGSRVGKGDLVIRCDSLKDLQKLMALLRDGKRKASDEGTRYHAPISEKDLNEAILAARINNHFGRMGRRL